MFSTFLVSCPASAGLFFGLMYRIRRPDGSLSVMVNRLRAKDALLDYEATKALSAWLPSPPERSRGHQED